MSITMPMAPGQTVDRVMPLQLKGYLSAAVKDALKVDDAGSFDCPYPEACIDSICEAATRWLVEEFEIKKR